MGNCAFKGFGGAPEDLLIRVATCGGGVMELHPPVTAECVTHGFPGHGVFRSADGVVSRPLLHNEELLAGELYYLRPLNCSPRAGLLPSAAAPYRVSFDHQGFWKRQEMEVLPRWSGGGLGNAGTWRVRLVISPAELAEILSQGPRTEALIESVRTVAKCGSGVAASAASSDQCSLACSRKASSESMP